MEESCSIRLWRTGESAEPNAGLRGRRSGKEVGAFLGTSWRAGVEQESGAAAATGGLGKTGARWRGERESSRLKDTLRPEAQ